MRRVALIVGLCLVTLFAGEVLAERKRAAENELLSSHHGRGVREVKRVATISTPVKRCNKTIVSSSVPQPVPTATVATPAPLIISSSPIVTSAPVQGTSPTPSAKQCSKTTTMATPLPSATSLSIVPSASVVGTPVPQSIATSILTATILPSTASPKQCSKTTITPPLPSATPVPIAASSPTPGSTPPAQPHPSTSVLPSATPVPSPTPIKKCNKTVPQDPCTVARDIVLNATSGCSDIAPLCTGRVIHLRGKFCSNANPNRYTVNFVSNDGIALHFDIRFNFGGRKKYVVMNSKLRGRRAFNGKMRLVSEGTSGFPFSAGGAFHLIFRVEGNTFKIAANGQKLQDFPLRQGFSMSAIRRVCYGRCGDMDRISLGYVQPQTSITPTLDPRCTGVRDVTPSRRSRCARIAPLCDTRTVTFRGVSGVMCDKRYGFNIDFQTRRGLAFRFNIKSNVVKYKSFERRRETDVRIAGNFPFSRPAPWAMEFRVSGNTFQITANNQALPPYTLRGVTMGDIQTVCYWGCRGVRSIRLGNSTP